ncbi:UDP-2,3-diacylglucosamine diphosphatase [Herbaspirillum sp. RTI4]|uniref:UDP-2,3-diacylglucosamine diphosphatase n=1 Tax=Herbaspirillum sp. RTI4 TaxID=3048640 RepID=UPI002AB42002|nr:UDP-2,3-diacylglucosamine diphosphatase [Herbaspirillum sp. RTI4]MDY7578625.1 UDP-2,3-diacylglucosamine diphosphatase [Herbaspirillum sp. RTI4]MEA9981069.1 UDP-2,3-diacylglucosamine diphosphatase [Herbaspirillum sp. RTI4]
MPALNSISAAQPSTVALFVSDLHLQASLPRTADRFFRFLQEQAMQTSQLFLLGDIFEYWAGDDDLTTPFNHTVAQALRQVSDAGVGIFWIAGNRDFLAGADFAAAAGLTLLPDPFVLDSAGLRIALAHGDAQCTDDTSYMAFRQQVRQADWQKTFLALPLAQRKAIIEGLRKNSQAATSEKTEEIMDVNGAAIDALFDSVDTNILIHGHTHRPALHVHAGANGERLRYVLPDWDYDAEPARGGWITLGGDGVLQRYDVDGEIIPG